MKTLPEFPKVPGFVTIKDNGRSMQYKGRAHSSICDKAFGHDRVFFTDDPYMAVGEIEERIVSYAESNGVFPMSQQQEAGLVPKWVEEGIGTADEWWHRNVDVAVVKSDGKGGATMYGVDTQHHWTKDALLELIPALDFVATYGRLPRRLKK